MNQETDKNLHPKLKTEKNPTIFHKLDYAISVMLKKKRFKSPKLLKHNNYFLVHTYAVFFPLSIGEILKTGVEGKLKVAPTQHFPKLSRRNKALTKKDKNQREVKVSTHPQDISCFYQDHLID